MRTAQRLGLYTLAAFPVVVILHWLGFTFTSFWQALGFWTVAALWSVAVDFIDDRLPVTGRRVVIPVRGGNLTMRGNITPDLEASLRARFEDGAA